MHYFTSLNKTKIRVVKAALTISFLIAAQLSFSQETQLKYKIMQGDDQIGSMTATKNTANSKTSFTMISEVKTKMVFTIEVYEKHTADFTNNILANATALRKVNDKVKLDKQITCTGSNCVVTKDGETSSSEQKPITQTVLNIYFFEPEKITEVYSDNFEKMLPLKNLDNHGYQLSLPDGDTIEYYYNNNVCSRVKVNKTLYNLEFVLVP